MTLQAALLTAMNAERARAGVPQFATHPTLQKAAQDHAEWMAANQNLDHYGAGGSTFTQRIHAAGMYPSVAAAENIAGDFRTAAFCVAAWMSSRGHRSNMLNPSYLTTGCGIAVDRNGEFYWCAVYGAAKAGSVSPPVDIDPDPPPRLIGWLEWLRRLLRR